MKKSHKIIASLAAVGALCVGTAAIAGPWHHDGEVRGGMPCAGYASQDYQAAGWEAVARLVTITPEQQGAWKAYVDARTALDMMPGVQFDKPAVDEQSRLERLFETLSRRERQIFVLVCQGLRNGDIAELLNLSQRTVEVHRAHISRKLGNASPIRLLYELTQTLGGNIISAEFDGLDPQKLANAISAGEAS